MLHLFEQFDRPVIDREFFDDTYAGDGSLHEIHRLLAFMEASPRVQRTDEIAYMLGTIRHECGKPMLPREEITDVKKAPWLKGKTLRYMLGQKYSGELHGGNNLFFGRGYPQTTWYENYEKFEKLTGLPFLENPDLLLIPKNSYTVMELGMFDGVFTDGRYKMKMFFHDQISDFYNARKIINLMDQAGTVADYSRQFFEALRLKDLRLG